METQKLLFDTRVNVFLRGHGLTFPGGLRAESSDPVPEESLRWARIGFGCFRSPTAGLKPFADGIRNMPPFGLPKVERQAREGVARSRFDRPRDGSGARVHRHRRLRYRSPHRPPSDREPRLREGRLSGFTEAFAEVLRHRVGGGIRVAEAAPTGALYARFVVQPAYSLGPHSVSPLRRLAGGRAPSDPRTGNGAP